MQVLKRARLGRIGTLPHAITRSGHFTRTVPDISCILAPEALRVDANTPGVDHTCICPKKTY